jgi:hypothetical protein
MTRALLVLTLAAGCDWDLNRMTEQPRCEPGDRTRWLPDQRCDQSPPEGTVEWRSKEVASPPPPVTRESIMRGADRYTRFCSPCHGTLGDANTQIARDMTLRPPPSLHLPRIVDYSDQRIYDVITTGYGMMPTYAWQVAPPDRWTIVQYVRVLQRSQAMPLQALSAARQEEARPWLR